MTQFPHETPAHRTTRRPRRALAAAGLAACALLLGACTSSGNHGTNSTGSTSPSGSAPATGSTSPSPGATSGGTASGGNSSPSTLPGNHNALIYHGVSKSQADRIQQQVAGVSGVSQVLYYSDSKVLEVDMTKQATKADRTAVKNLVAQNLAKK